MGRSRIADRPRQDNQRLSGIPGDRMRSGRALGSRARESGFGALSFGNAAFFGQCPGFRARTRLGCVCSCRSTFEGESRIRLPAGPGNAAVCRSRANRAPNRRCRARASCPGEPTWLENTSSTVWRRSLTVIRGGGIGCRRSWVALSAGCRSARHEASLPCRTTVQRMARWCSCSNLTLPFGPGSREFGGSSTGTKPVPAVRTENNETLESTMAPTLLHLLAVEADRPAGPAATVGRWSSTQHSMPKGRLSSKPGPRRPALGRAIASIAAAIQKRPKSSPPQGAAGSEEMDRNAERTEHDDGGPETGVVPSTGSLLRGAMPQIPPHDPPRHQDAERHLCHQ